MRKITIKILFTYFTLFLMLTFVTNTFGQEDNREIKLKELAKLFSIDARNAPTDTYEDYLSKRKKVKFSHQTKVYPGIKKLNKTLEGEPISKILVIVESDIYSAVTAKITRYINDVQNHFGCDIIFEEVTGGSAEDIKSLIVNNSTNLNGAVLIGDLPAAWYEVDNNYWGFGYESWPCDLFYMDIDGTWSDTDNDNIYDSHTGDVSPEIFVGRISTSNMGNLVNEINGMNSYLDKNHNFWLGNISITGKDGLAYVDSTWAGLDDFKKDIRILYGGCNSESYNQWEDGFFGKTDYMNNRLNNSQYGLIQICTHAEPVFHDFTGGNIYANEIFNLGPKAIAYNLFACSGCRWTSATAANGYIGGAYIYNSSSTALVAVGSTKTGSMLGFNHFYTPLCSGDNYGTSLKKWWNTYVESEHTEYEISWFYGLTIVGDPMIYLSNSNPHITSGTLTCDESWPAYGHTLTGDIYVPSNTELYISSTSSINLVNGSNRYSIISTGGTIIVEEGATIVGLQATLKNGSDEYLALIGSSIGTTTLTSGQTLTVSGSLTVNGNITVQSGASCNINSGSTINLGTNSIISSGGTITKGSNVTINGLRATIKNTSQNIKALCGTISSGASNCSTGDYIELESGTYTENVTFSGKNYIDIIGNNASLNGSLTFSNSYAPAIWDLSVKELHLLSSNSPIVDNVTITSGYNDGSFEIYNCTDSDVRDLTIYDRPNYIGAYLVTSDGSVQSSSFTNLYLAMDIYNSDYEIYNGTEFCQNEMDITAGSSYVFTYNCILSYYGSTAGVTNYYPSYCGLLKSNSVSNSNIDAEKDFSFTEFNKLRELLQELREKLKAGKTGEKDFDRKKLLTDYNKLIAASKSFILSSKDTKLSTAALKMAVSCYKQLEDYEGMKVFLYEIIGDKTLNNLKGYAKRYLMDYYIFSNSYNEAITTADEILREKTNTEDLICDVLFAKGLVYEYSLNNNDEAVKIYEKLMSDYSTNPISRLAKNQLKKLGKEVEEKENAAELNVVSNEIEIGNYPNPFNPSTTISYTLPEEGVVQLKIYDMLGREVATLLDEFRNAGRHSIIWDGNNSASGIYFYRITFNNKTINKKMLLIK